jgi:hypothetical protein
MWSCADVLSFFFGSLTMKALNPGLSPGWQGEAAAHDARRVA